MKAELLWTNDSPTTSVKTLNLSLNLNGYEAVLIYTRPSTYDTTGVYGYAYCLVGQQGIVGANYNTSSGFTRVVTVNKSSVSFAETKGGDQTSGSALSNPSRWAIPYKIYGIKKNILP